MCTSLSETFYAPCAGHSGGCAGKGTVHIGHQTAASSHFKVQEDTLRVW